MIKKTKEKLGNLECVVAQDSNCSAPKACVILCHGFGAPSTDLVALAEPLIQSDVSLQDVVFVFPGAPIELDPLYDARAWWMIDMEKIQQLMMSGETREMKSSSPELLPERRADLTKVIDHCRVNYNLPAAKIVIGGFSQGAMLSTEVALHYNESLGGLVIWSGSFINETIWSEKIKSHSGLNIVQSHGRVDPILPMIASEELRDAFVEAGHKIRFHEFPGQHSIPMEAIGLAAELIKEVCQ